MTSGNDSLEHSYRIFAQQALFGESLEEPSEDGPGYLLFGELPEEFGRMENT